MFYSLRQPAFKTDQDSLCESCQWQKCRHREGRLGKLFRPSPQRLRLIRMPHIRRFLRNSYVVAVLATSAVPLVLKSLQPIINGPAPLLLFLLAIIFSAWYGGFKAGLFATVLSLLTSFYFLIDPSPLLFVTQTNVETRLLLLVGIGGMLSLAVALWRKALKESLQRKAAQK